MNTLFISAPTQFTRRQARGWIKESINQITPEHKDIEVDLSTTSRIEAPGIAALLTLRRALREDATLRLIDSTGRIMKTLEIMGMHRLFQFASKPTLTKAEKQRPIIIVEDDLIGRNLATMVLKPFGLPVLTTDNGEDALKMIEKETPALIILDYQLPVCNGAEVHAKIKADPATRDIPVIVITANPEGARTDFAQTDGPAFVLPKPLKVEELRSLAAKLIVQANHPDALLS